MPLFVNLTRRRRRQRLFAPATCQRCGQSATARGLCSWCRNRKTRRRLDAAKMLNHRLRRVWDDVLVPEVPF